MAMGSSQTHFNQLLTNASIAYRNVAFVADLVARPWKVAMESDEYTIFDKSRFSTVNDSRADGDPENAVDVGWKWAPYRVEGHGLRTRITKRQRQNYDLQKDLEIHKTEVIKERVLLGLEQRVFGAGGLLRTTANNIDAQNRDWTNVSTADPRGDFEIAIGAVEAASGRTPNTVVMTPAVARHIMRTSQYRDETKYTVNLSTQGGAAELPSEFYGLRSVYVGALINSANKGQAEVLSRLMGDDVWVGYVDPAEAIGPETLTAFSRIYTDEYVRKWWDDEIEADWVAYNLNYTLVTIARECGYLMQTVTTG